MERCKHVRSREEGVIKYLSLSIKCKIGESLWCLNLFLRKKKLQGKMSL